MAIVLETKVQNKLHISWCPLMAPKDHHSPQPLSHPLLSSCSRTTDLKGRWRGGGWAVEDGEGEKCG